MKNPTFGVIGIPLIYGFSWLLLMLGIYLAGPKYGKALGRWTVRVILEKILGDEAKTIRFDAVEGSEKRHNKKIKRVRRAG